MAVIVRDASPSGKTIPKRLLRHRRNLEELAQVLERFGQDLGETVSHYARDIEVITDYFAGHPVEALVAVATRAVSKKDLIDVLQAAAERGVTGVSIVCNVDGSAKISIDGGKAFRLPRQLATLLALLAADDGCAEDGFVAWKRTSDLALALGKESRRPIDVPRVNGLVHKLRRALRDAGQNWFLVDGDRRGQVRFALRAKPKSQVIAGDRK